MNTNIINTHLKNLEKAFPSVDSATLFYSDGITIASTMDDISKIDEWAALAASAHSLANKTTELLNAREIQCSVIKTERKVVVFVSLGDDLVLMVLGQKNLNTAVLVPELKRMMLAMSNLLD